MFNKYSVLGQSLQAGVDLTKQTGLQVIKLPGDVVKGAGTQLTGATKPTPLETEQNKESAEAQKVVSKQQNKDFLKSLYGISGDGSQSPAEMVQKTPSGKNPLEQQNLEAVRLQLHGQKHNEEYYQPLINRPKKQEEVERPAERVERQEMEDLQKEDKKQQEKPKVLQNADGRIESQRGATG